MAKTYSDFMREITPDELYNCLIQYGLFSEKLPPVFDSSSFFLYCCTPDRPAFADKWYPYATYDSMRNINIPRHIGIPVPMGYERLCGCLRDNWPTLQTYFHTTTLVQTHIVSRIHIRKIHGENTLFKMNYKNWRVDGTPEPDLLFGKRYVVCADISKCFPSIYTHAIAWALAGKQVAKQNSRNKDEWYNQIDHWAQISKNGETHGVLIGPQTSNILSEIILCKIDEELCSKWEYIRNIDDFCCYVKSQEEADDFLIDLNRCLKEYDLLLNHEKTEIHELPLGSMEQWIHQLLDKALYFEKFQPYVDYKEVQAFLDFCIRLMSANKDNASIILYGLKVFQGHTLTQNAQTYLSKVIMSLSLIYPYIVPLLDKYLFEPYSIDLTLMEKYLNEIYNRYFSKNYYEACSYTLYYATKYNINIAAFDVNEIIEKQDAILMLLALIYCRKKIIPLVLDI